PEDRQTGGETRRNRTGRRQDHARHFKPAHQRLPDDKDGDAEDRGNQQLAQPPLADRVARKPGVERDGPDPERKGKDDPAHHTSPVRRSVSRWISPMIPTSPAARIAAANSADQIWMVWP